MRKMIVFVITLLFAAVCSAGCAAAPLAAPENAGEASTVQESCVPVYTVGSTETQLSVTPDAAPLIVKDSGAARTTIATSFTIAWFTDPQGYSQSAPEIFDSMTGWIAANAEKEHIVYSIGTGDFVNHYDAPQEWDNAVRALGLLGDVPLFAVAGNHDVNGFHQNYDNYLQRLGKDSFRELPTNGGFYEDGKGRFDLVDVNGVPLLLLGVGYGMDDKAIDWMNSVLSAYPDRIAILCLHGYIAPDGSFSSDGEKLYPAVVEKNPNVRLVLCGHRHGVGHTATALDDNGDGKPGRTVYAMVADYQDEPKYGGGYFCLLTFDPQKEELRVRTYSPYLDDLNCYADESGLEEYVLPFTFNQ